MWIDSDAMIVDPTFEIPFHTFGGKDLVAWGNEAELRAGNALAGRPHRPGFAHWKKEPQAICSIFLCVAMRRQQVHRQARLTDRALYQSALAPCCCAALAITWHQTLAVRRLVRPHCIPAACDRGLTRRAQGSTRA